MKDAIGILGIFFICIGIAKLCFWAIGHNKG